MTLFETGLIADQTDHPATKRDQPISGRYIPKRASLGYNGIVQYSSGVYGPGPLWRGYYAHRKEGL